MDNTFNASQVKEYGGRVDYYARNRVGQLSILNGFDKMVEKIEFNKVTIE